MSETKETWSDAIKARKVGLVKTFLPLGMVAIQSCGTAAISVQTQIPFKLKRLLLTDGSKENFGFRVLDVRVKKFSEAKAKPDVSAGPAWDKDVPSFSVFAGTGSLPGSFFTTERNIEIDVSTLQISDALTVLVENIGPNVIHLQGGAWGFALDGSHYLGGEPREKIHVARYGEIDVVLLGLSDADIEKLFKLRMEKESSWR
jgi:hypothetical protein